MAARIVPFPARSGQTEVMERIRRYLAELSSDQELINTVAAKMKLFIDRYADKDFTPAFDLAVPAGISPREAQALLRSVEKGVDAAVGQFDRMICEIIVERMFLEIELYEQRKKERDDDPSRTNLRDTSRL